ncbi:beta-glucosidase [Acidianus sulfidivorans JP7]|uniref:Beta-glucosidase n=1 Tax=Acidianus sulfidivorans JP7 TaxID=619593 RepID=A0A2U9ILL4_9CREN|nr:GH116 family glycosyl hydrolase [Acidianus sulfidivorans]AWR96885.1 beta-glucosidase [Acidianus sulfidivorans JP7]
MKYTNSYVLASGVPLGGIGTGSLELRADGRFYDWTIFNNGGYAERQEIRYTYYLNEFDSFLVVRKDNKVRILQAYNYYYNVNPYTVPWIKPVKEIEFIGEPPLAYLVFKDDIIVKMKAFSSFVPHDLKNSSLPAVILKIDFDGIADLLFGIKNPFAENGKIENSNDMLIFSGNVDPKDPRYNGNLCIKIIGNDTYTSKLSYFPTPKEWYEFRETGKISVKDGENLGLIGAKGKEITIIISWYFPNHLLTNGYKIGHYYENFFSNCADVVNYVQSNLNTIESKTTQFHDLLYSPQGIENWIADLIGSQLSTLVKSTWLGKDGFFGLWEGYFESSDIRKNGQYPYNGGPVHTALNTIDVTLYYAYSLLVLFPELAKSVMKFAANNILDENKEDYIIYSLGLNENRKLFLDKLSKDPSIVSDLKKLTSTIKEIVKETSKDPKGRVPHFITDNLKIDEYNRNDLNPEFVLIWYLISKMSGDKEFFTLLYNKAKEAIDSILRTHSYEGLLYNRLPAGVDWSRYVSQEFKNTVRGISGSILPELGYDMVPMSLQTYDDWTMLGISSFTSILWLAALKAFNEASSYLGKDYNYNYDEPLQKLIKYLWNGEYFDLWYDPISQFRDNACNASQLIGEWYMTLLDMNLLNKEMVHKTLKSIIRYNFKNEEGVINGAYPDGYRPMLNNYKNPLNLPASIQFDTPWSGVEFYLASHLIYEKMVEDGIKVLKGIYDRYAVAGHFWDHIEWGAHYSRPLSAISVIPAFEGIKYEAFKNTLIIDPAISELSWILLLPTMLGKISIKEREISIKALEGNLRINSIRLNYRPSAIKLNGANITFKTEEIDQKYEVLINIDIKEGDVLEIS